MKTQLQLVFSSLFIFIFISQIHLSFETNTIFPSQSITRNQTITSQNQIFELGFFKPGNSKNYFLGIKYKRILNTTLVWVANRDNPLSEKSSYKLELTSNGNLVLTNQDFEIWSSNTSLNMSYMNTSVVAVLEDTGNLVLKTSMNSSDVIWQSFDHPSDTWLPGAKLGFNKLNRRRQVYVSWKDPNDPSPGPFSLELDTNETKQYFIMEYGYRHWTCGIWPGRVSVFGPDRIVNSYNDMVYVSNGRESYFVYSVTNASVLTRFVMDSTGQLRQLVWNEESEIWDLIWARPKHQCEIYAYCGQFGGCNQFGEPKCRCLHGFEPREWTVGINSSEGCIRRNPLMCNKGGKDGFLTVPNIRLPANSITLAVKSSEECESACLKNCSCTAYTYDYECLIWKENLLNIQYLSFGDNLGRTLHLRLATKELMSYKGSFKGRILGMILGGAAGIFVLCILLWVIVLRTKRFSGSMLKVKEESLVVFKYRDLRIATKNFSIKVGEGGFGSVFRGELKDSGLIAVKKLKCCKQEEKQFRAEVSTMGRLHHINLVCLRGFCVHGNKRFLVYDYMPNRSLESHLFAKELNIILDWNTRYRIAHGIARGLCYLHEKCVDCIIHCDIKPENILLDALYNPRVSDFGLAKLIGREFSRVLTTVKGTRGYLAPEWISGVAITPKADVFSYGMMLFEIISGKRNWEVRVPDEEKNEYFPLQIVDELNKGGEIGILSLLDCSLDGNANLEEVIRLARVAGWCIQDDEKDRPSMGCVLQILEGVKEVTIPPIPKFLKHIAVSFGKSMDPDSLCLPSCT